MTGPGTPGGDDDSTMSLRGNLLQKRVSRDDVDERSAIVPHADSVG